MNNSSGMTLLELLIALAVFALLSIMAYGGLRSVLTADQATSQQADDLTRLQQALGIINRDLLQLVNRPVRDSFGDLQPALDGRQEQRLELTRAGWSNPAQRVRSTLQRVAYRQDGDELIHEFWSVLDRAQDSEPYQTTLIDGVQRFEYRFLDATREWSSEWPIQDEQDPDQTETPSLPVAVEVILEHEKWGRLNRVIPLF